MSTLPASLLAIGFSLALLTVLALRDPKRLRTSGIAAANPTRAPLPRGAHRMLGWASLLPGLALSAYGQWPALLARRLLLAGLGADAGAGARVGARRRNRLSRATPFPASVLSRIENGVTSNANGTGAALWERVSDTAGSQESGSSQWPPSIPSFVVRESASR